MSAVRIDQGPGQFLDGAWKSMLERSREKRTKIATQTWPEFFKGLAIEFAAIGIIVLIVAGLILFAR